MLRGYDVDGTLTTGLTPIEPYVIISGRTFGEYNDYIKFLATKAPVYIRGTGEYGDRNDAGMFKANMINMLGISEFYEDDPVQIQIIIANTTAKCSVYQVFPDSSVSKV